MADMEHQNSWWCGHCTQDTGFMCYWVLCMAGGISGDLHAILKAMAVQFWDCIIISIQCQAFVQRLL